MKARNPFLRANILVLLLLVSAIPPTHYWNATLLESGSPLHPGMLLMPRTSSPIKHVIIAIQENHAFDNYFWDYPGAFGLPPGGVPQPSTQINTRSYQNEYPLGWSYPGNQSFSSPAHGADKILSEQDNGSMDGFYYTNNATPDGLFPTYIVANELGLAQEYAISDNYFTAFAGPTLPNRFYYYAITSGPVLGDGNPPGNVVSFPTLPQELQNRGISWASFDGDYNQNPGTSCTLALFPTDPCWYFSYLPTSPAAQLAPMLYLNWIQSEYNNNGTIPQLQTFSNLFTDLSSGTLPSVSWFTSDWACCTEHPSDATISFIGGNVTKGQQAVLKLVHAVEDSQYWNSTAIFLTYDEGGGFFDHSPSPVATPYGTGIRVPLVIISPYSREGYVSHAYYTPASLLHFIEWNWGIPSLGGLDSQANLPLDVFNFTATPRPNLPQSTYGSNNLTQFPWVIQPVSPAYKGLYTPKLLSSGNVNWTFQTLNSITSSPVLSATEIYECGMDGALRAFEPVTGAQLWSHQLGSACRSSPTPLPGGGVAVTTLHGIVSAVRPDGSVRWNLSVTSPIYGNLTPVGPTLYGSMQNGTLFAVNGSSGSLQWEHHVSTTPMYSAPVYSAALKLLLVNVGSGGVQAVNLSGKPIWNAPIPNGTYAAGTLCNGTYYVTSPGGGLYAVAGASGSKGPSVQLNRSVATPLCLGNTLYVGDNSTFRAFSLPSLTPLWSSPVYGEVSGAPILNGGDLVVVTQGGNIYYFPENGPSPNTILQSGASFFSSPTAIPSGLYFTAEDGNLYARLSGGEIRVSVSPPNATVTISGGATIPLSGGNGSVLETSGRYTLSASAPGYVSSNTSVLVTTGHVRYVNFTLSKTIPPPLVQSFSATPPQLSLGNSTTFAVVASGGTLPYNYAYSGLPPGCSSSSVATLTCKPTSTGSFTVSVVLTDSAGRTAMASTTLTVFSNEGPTIASFTANPSTMSLGNTTLFSVQVLGGKTPYSFSYTGLPGGCTSSDVPSFKCTPIFPGEYPVTVTVVDSNKRIATQSVTLTVISPAGFPAISQFTAKPATLVLGGSTVFSVSVTGGTVPYHYLYSGLPPGCSTTNAPSMPCTPAKPGHFSVYVNVTDANGHTAQSSAPLAVDEASGPVLTTFTASPNPVAAGSSTVFKVVASGGSSPYSYAYSHLPQGCTSGNTSALSCVPSKVGVYTINVTVTDTFAKTANGTLTLTVVQPGSGSSSTGLPDWMLTFLFAGMLVAAAIVISVVMIRRRRRKVDAERSTVLPAPGSPPSPGPHGPWTE